MDRPVKDGDADGDFDCACCQYGERLKTNGFAERRFSARAESQGMGSPEMLTSAKLGDIGEMARTTYIVDDDNDVRKAFRFLLELQPDQIILDFNSGDRFLAAAEKLEPGVLLLDLNMPGLNGLEVLTALQTRHPGKFAILILTGMGTVPQVLDAMRGGVLDFIEKPCATQLLLDTVDAAHAILARDSAAAAAAERARSRIASLSQREHDVLLGLLGGHANKDIAAALDISARTVEIYRSNMMAKLKVRSLSGAIRLALVAGMAPQPLSGTKGRAA
jgi:two-component system response regulator FixJ